VLVADGAGVTTADCDVVGTTVGFGVLALGVGVAGIVLAVGLGVVADRAGEGIDPAGAVGRAGLGESVAEWAGPKRR